MKFHIETIMCPECGHVQKAKVEHTGPWMTYIHTCKKCEYLIMESEWLQFDQHAIRQVNTIYRMNQVTKGKKWYNVWIPDTPKWWRPNKWRRWDKKYRNEPRHKYKKNALRRKESENLPF